MGWRLAVLGDLGLCCCVGGGWEENPLDGGGGWVNVPL